MDSMDNLNTIITDQGYTKNKDVFVESLYELMYRFVMRYYPEIAGIKKEHFHTLFILARAFDKSPESVPTTQSIIEKLMADYQTDLKQLIWLLNDLEKGIASSYEERKQSFNRSTWDFVLIRELREAIECDTGRMSRDECSDEYSINYLFQKNEQQSSEQPAKGD